MHEHRIKLQKSLLEFTRRDWPSLPNNTNHLSAGVLIPIIADAFWTCILTKRSAHLREHSKEICFPGGKPDPIDKCLEETALREAKEELNLEGGKVLAELSSIPLYTSPYRIHPFLAIFPEGTSINANPNEVEEVLSIPILSVLTLPFLDGTPFEFHGKKYLSPIFLPKKVGIPIEQPIFGGTAHALYEAVSIIASALDIAVPPLQSTFDQFPFIQAKN